MEAKNRARDMLFGLCVGDALGVPVEFHPRFERERDPVTGMRGFGTWNQPPGTWSDDSALSFCLADSLCSGYDIRAIGASFVRWMDQGFWSATGTSFDIGTITKMALERVRACPDDPLCAGFRRDEDNRNGSLMRILPIAFHVRDLPETERWNLVSEVSSITHAHPRSTLACVILVEVALGLLEALSPDQAYVRMKETVLRGFRDEGELAAFRYVLAHDLSRVNRDEIRSGCDVVDTLEAGLWCLLTSRDYPEAVLKAVNLGEDTDTTAAVTGGLAGLAWGMSSIPEEWLRCIARRDDIENLAARFHAATSSGN